MKRIALIFALALAAPAFADTLYVTEFVGTPPKGLVYQAVTAPRVANQTVAIGATSTQSAAFDAASGIIRVHADIACLVEVGGTNPTAVATSMRLAAGQTEYFVIQPGAKIAVKTP